MSSSVVGDLVSRGSMLLKVNGTGKPFKKHIYVTHDNRNLKWEPSRKTADPDFLDLDQVEAVRFGLQGKRLESLVQDDNMRIFLQQRQQFPVDDVCGYLSKQGGAKGGSKAWQKRWFVLQGSSLYYFSNPTDIVYKGLLPLSGSIARASDEDDLTIEISWPGTDNAERKLKVGSVEERNTWIAAMKRALRVDRLRTGMRPNAMAKQGASTAGGKERAADAREVAPDLNVPIGDLGLVSLSFVLKGGEKKEGKEPVALVCGSLVGVESWYLGLVDAIAARRKLDTAGVAQLHSASIAASTGGGAAATPARVGLALTLEKLGQVDEAVAKLKDAVAAQPYTAAGRKALGRLLLERDDAEAATPHLRAAAALQERQDASTLLMLGSAFERTAALRLAAAAYEMALTIEPRLIQAHTSLGAVQLAQGMVKDAVTHFRSALGANPGDPLVHASLGEALKQLGGHEEESAAEFEAACAGAPHLNEPHVALAELLPALDRHAEAVPHLRTVMAAVSAGKLDFHLPSVQIMLASALIASEAARYPAILPALASAQAAAASVAMTSSVSMSLLSNEEEDDGGDEDEGANAGDGEAPAAKELPGAATPDPAAASPPPATPMATSSDTLPTGRVAVSLPVLPPLGEPVRSGVPSVDGLTSLQLLGEARALLALAEPELGEELKGQARLLLGRVEDRTGDLCERSDADAGRPLDVLSNRAQAEAAYAAAAAAGGPTAGEASLWLGRLLKKTGRVGDAVAPLTAAVDSIEAGGLSGGAVVEAEAKDLLERCKRLAAGQAEFPIVEKRKAKKDEDLQFSDMGLPAGVSFDGMTPEERKAAFFNHMKAQKKEAEEAAKAAEDLKLSRMTDEEKKEYLEEKEKQEKHAARKDKSLSKQMAAYGGGTGKGAALLAKRGRGGRATRGGR